MNIVLQNPRPRDYDPLVDWTGGDPYDDAWTITDSQIAWDKAYEELGWFGRLRYNFLGWRP